MEEKHNATVLGIAYEIEESNVEKTFNHLDFREKCGYTKHEVAFYPLEKTNEKIITCVCYYADDTNSYYSKILDKNLIADHIIKSKGPSGTNIEYFLNICNALRNLIKQSNNNELYANNEKHLFELEEVIENKLKNKK